MADKDTLLEPMIFHGPGGCPRCSGPLCVADSEITLMELNPDGVPISEETNIRCKAVCMHCGNTIQMARWGGQYIPYGRSALIIKNGELKAEAEERVRKINEKAKGKNPFALEKE